jgi:hypothetical protein
MIETIVSLLDASDVVILVVCAVLVAGVVMTWWEFYAKPCRDSLADIARCLNAAPWMRQGAADGKRRIA